MSFPAHTRMGASAALLLALATACSHRMKVVSLINSTPEFQGQAVPARAGGRGEVRLALEAEYDPTIDAYLKQNGKPDYVYVVEANEVWFLYIADDRAVQFKRNTQWVSASWRNPSTMSVDHRIPDFMSMQFTRPDRDELARVRASRADDGNPAAAP